MTQLIDRQAAVNGMLHQFPEFNQDWKQYQSYWNYNSPGVCTDLAAFAKWFSNIDAPGDTLLRAVFKFVETLVDGGDDDVQTAATTCLLENLMNTLPPNTFWERYSSVLGPKSRTFCLGWDQFTGVATPSFAIDG